MMDVDPTKQTTWANQDACHAALRAAGAEWDLVDRGVTPADINWLVLGLTQPAVRAAFTFFILIWLFWRGWIGVGGGGGGGGMVKNEKNIENF